MGAVSSSPAMRTHTVIAALVALLSVGHVSNACFSQTSQCESQIVRVFSGFVISLCDAIYEVNEIEASREECRNGRLRKLSYDDLIDSYCVPLGLSGDKIDSSTVTCTRCEAVVESVLTCDNLGLTTNQTISDCYEADYYGTRPLLLTKACFHLGELCPDVSCQECPYCPGCGPGGSAWGM